jgi:hypothetical protein
LLFSFNCAANVFRIESFLVLCEVFVCSKVFSKNVISFSAQQGFIELLCFLTSLVILDLVWYSTLRRSFPPGFRIGSVVGDMDAFRKDLAAETRVVAPEQELFDRARTPEDKLLGKLAGILLLKPSDARSLRHAFPTRMLWYKTSDGKDLLPSACSCFRCGSPLKSCGSRYLQKMALDTDGMFHAIVPRLRCSLCNFGVNVLHEDFARMLPGGAVPDVRCDVVGGRIFTCGLTDWLCATLRKDFSKARLRQNYVERVCLGLREKEPPLMLSPLSEGSCLEPALYGYLHSFLPGPGCLSKVVLICFQKYELPRLRDEVRWVCGRFGAIMASDASSAPLSQARLRCKRAAEADDKRLKQGAALRVTGLFDVPLCPYVLVPSESSPAIGSVLAFLAAEAAALDSAAIPFGWVLDNTESMWKCATAIVEKLCCNLPAKDAICVDQREKKVEGFFLGIDVKHVEWRLVDALNSSSADFITAATALQVMMSRCFNPRDEISDSDSESTDGREQSDTGHGTGWEESWQRWLLNERVQRCVADGKAACQVYRQQLAGELDSGAGSKHRFRNDGAVPPRCVMHLFLCRLGARSEAESLWRDGEAREMYVNEMKEFSTWFAGAMAGNSIRALKLPCSN